MLLVLLMNWRENDPSEDQVSVTKLCDDHQVDVDYEKDRVAFFTAIVDKMENPYV
jgi:hypothetical protein